MITIFPLFKWVLGADHPNTLKGRMAEAIPLYRGALADCERVRGTDHPSTLRSRNNLAMAYRAAGRTADAISLYERTLTDRERGSRLRGPGRGRRPGWSPPAGWPPPSR